MNFKKPYFLKLICIHLFFACIFFVGILKAQPHYKITKYSQQEGLASSIVGRVFKDSTGYIWLLSEKGLNRFDGYTFKTYRHNVYDSTSISSSDVKTIWIDSDKNILFRTSNSICKFNQKNETFKSLMFLNGADGSYIAFVGEHGSWLLYNHQLHYLDATNEMVVSYKLPEKFIISNINDAFCYDNKIYFKEAHSFYLFDIATKKFKLVPVQYHDGLSDQYHQPPMIFFSRSDHSVGFCSFDGYFFYNPAKNAFILYHENTQTFDWVHDLSGNAIINKSYFVVALRTGKIACMNLDSGITTLLDLNKGQVIGQVGIIPFGVFQGNAGNALISTSNGGIFSVDPVNLSVDPVLDEKKGENGQIPLNIEFILKDKNVLWFTSPGNGLYKAEQYNPLFPSFDPYETTNGLNIWSHNIRAIAEVDSQNLIAGSLNGIYNFNRNSKNFSNVPSPVDGKPILENERVSKIIAGKDSIVWIASWSGKGVFALDYRNKKMITIQPRKATSGFTEYSIRSMLIDSHGFLWLGTSRDLIYRIRLSDINWNKPELSQFEEISRYLPDQQHLKFNFVFAIEEGRKGNVLIGSQEGYYIYNYANDNYIRYQNDPANPHSLSENNVRCIYEDKKGFTWIGTNGGGLNRFDPVTGQFTAFTVDNGLPDNSIYSILKDKNGLLWMGTNKGLCAFNPENLSCRNFTPEDGIQNFEFNTNSSCKTTDDYLAFGGINGFNLFHPDSVKLVENNFPLVITDLKIFDKAIPFSSNEIHLKYNENYISFQFALLSYFRNNENQYAYKLEGLDKGWINSGDRRFASYANLSPGRYTFYVKSANYTGIWNEPEIKVLITISTPWWSTWYFRLFILLGFFGMIYLFYRYRFNQAKKLQIIRNRIARDLHDEVGSNLSSISIFSEVASTKLGNDANGIKPLLNKISSYTQSSMEAISDIVWVISASNDRFENILIRMRQLAAESFENLECKMNLQLDERLNQLKIGMESRKNIYLIYKEALNNIVKYADSTHVDISVSQENHVIIMKISDNGKGFNISIQRKGNGLINMQKRAKALNGNLKIISEENKGTCITLSFPLS